MPSLDALLVIVAVAAVAGLLQATSLPFLVAASAIGRELGLIGAGEAAALVGAGLLSVLLLPAAGLALLRPVTDAATPRPHPVHRTKGPAMQTQCSSYATEDDARAAVERLLADGMPGTSISVLSGRMTPDHRDEPVGAFAGSGGAVGAYAGDAGAASEAMGAFASGAGEQRRGGYGDGDQDTVETYTDGVRRVHVASHRELEKRLAEAGLGADAIAADVEALHHGRVLVLVSAG